MYLMPVIIIKTQRFSDSRGWFCESYVDRRWKEYGVDAEFVQDNHSYSAAAETIRGIHFQTPPYAQAKLVRCVRGRIMDYAVDLRAGSPTFGKYMAAELSEKNGDQLFIPIGFGHAFITLEPDCEVIYKVSDYYYPECDGGIRWDCPGIDINWPLNGKQPSLSSKDRDLPLLAEFSSPFAYDGNPLTGLDG
jgi:dTDP-4-dehydrorhamnose 3,5-epimerase